jgi:hypothetical protein
MHETPWLHMTADGWRADHRDDSIARAVEVLTDPVRLASGPGRLEALSTAVEEAESAIRCEVALARRLGVSWAEIGANLNVSKQAAQQRYGALIT